MTRATVTITTYSQRVTCPSTSSGCTLYVRRVDVDRWLRELGWEVGGRDVCPGCREVAKVERVEGNGR